MSRRHSHIQDPFAPEPVQSNLFFHPGLDEEKQRDVYPEIGYADGDVCDIIETSGEKIGLDYEFRPSTMTPTIIGVAENSSGVMRCASVRHADEFDRALWNSGAQFVGHSVIDADKPVMDKILGFSTPLDRWEDTMIKHYLCNADFCAAPGKDEDDDDAGALGLMNLFTAASMTTRYPQWKACRGPACFGPCPRHNVFGYCAVDAAAGLAIDDACDEEMREKGIPRSLYERLRDLSAYCGDMKAQGIKVDREWIKVLEERIATKKEDLFPFEMRGKKKVYGYRVDVPPEEVDPMSGETSRFVEGPFNPQSPAQVYAYFKERGIDLKGRGGDPAVDRATLYKMLDKQLKKYGYNYHVDKKSGEFIVNEEAIWPVVEDLLKLYQFKKAGKGLGAWFDEKYIAAGDLIHPRFIVTGTATGRLASSGPNFQNIPRLGFGAEVRRAIIPRSTLLKLGKADKRQLEWRVVRWYSGDTRPVMADEFTLLAQDASGAFAKPSQRLGCTERDVSKSVVHACLTGNHQVLTPSGWKYIDQCAENTRIAQWHPDGAIDFVKPSKYWYFWVDEPLVHLSGRGLETVCTKNHELPVTVSGTDTVYKRRYDNLYRRTPDDLPKSGRIPISGVLNNPDYPISDADIQRAVAIQADGSFVFKQDGVWIKFHLVKSRKRERLKELFGAEGIPCADHEDGERFYFPCPPGALLLLNAQKQFVPAVLQLSQRQREIFLAELAHWDGSSRSKSGAVYYHNTDYTSVELVQTIAHLSGRQALVRYTDSPNRKRCYKVSFNQRQYASVSQLNRKDIPYSGYVYCFTVPTGFFLVRYNDRISVTGNSNYMEGLVVLTEKELATQRRQSEIRQGALLVFDGKHGRRLWTYRGGYVAFTGANLAERLFGDRTFESRKLALHIQEIYFRRYPDIRWNWHYPVSQRIEKLGYVQSHTGRYLSLYGSAEDDLKLAVAFLGQGGGADEVQEGMLRFQSLDRVALIQVHDELVFEIPHEYTDTQTLKFFEPFCEPSELFPGLVCPIEVKVGPNWKDTKAIN